MPSDFPSFPRHLTAHPSALLFPLLSSALQLPGLLTYSSPATHSLIRYSPYQFTSSFLVRLLVSMCLMFLLSVYVRTCILFPATQYLNLFLPASLTFLLHYCILDSCLCWTPSLVLTHACLFSDPSCSRSWGSTPGPQVLPSIKPFHALRTTSAALSFCLPQRPTHPIPGPSILLQLNTLQLQTSISLEGSFPNNNNHTHMEIQLASRSRMINNTDPQSSNHRRDNRVKPEVSSGQSNPIKASRTHNELHKELLLAHKRLAIRHLLSMLLQSFRPLGA
ncbi:uncharacterized protein si:ch211-218o21.4 isoform X3 [Siniperca chuatsi]|uniref:uncharacterized protein si:ch211-218o21.4 isoform X3 n=1 Tax=Siniperca chuatsi TaxID=119488 RepID=UPI001CE21D92|nr:uncharacterized protein si:ch211-218o21.4 isoform X3 [Siniperca chuatsi]